ncbi:MAG: hypothetical protein AAGA48_06225 [Myxococcota bacterium]
MGAATKPGNVAVASVEQGDRRWLGRLAPPIMGGPPQLAFSLEDGPTKLALGSMVQLEVTAPRAEAGRGSTARLTAVAYLPSVVLIEVDAVNPSLWAEVLTGPVGEPADRRHWPRLSLPATDDPIEITIDSGPSSARTFAARVVDRSSEGLGLRFVQQAEPLLCRATEVVCRLPEEDPVVARIRHRRLLQNGVRYGLSVVGPASPPATTHEAQWTCPQCGEQPLLGERHAHCPSCGHARGNIPTRLADWDQLIVGREHPFSGIERTCLRCGCAWSALARNCGHCGTRLPIDQTRP